MSLPIRIDCYAKIKKVTIDYSQPEARVTFEGEIPARGHGRGPGVFNSATIQLPTELSSALFAAVAPFIEPNPYIDPDQWYQREVDR